MTSEIKNLALRTAVKVSAFCTLATARATYLVYCGEDKKKGSGAGGNAFNDAVNAASNLQENLYNLAAALFPLAIIICGVAMFFTRDQKKFDMEKHLMIGCCLAFALIVLVHKKGDLVSTIETIVAGGSKNPG